MIDKIKQEGRLLYQYIAGSTLYHCNETDGSSDIDTKGLFIATPDEMFGLGFDKQFRDRYKDKINLFEAQINDERNDNVIYEVGKYMGMLLSSNANVLESLYVPTDMIIVKPHKCLEGLFANRDKFITKDCFKPFIEYSIYQIEKARGLNKKINNPIVERKGVLDFAYTFFRQGSTNIQNWLEYRGLKQQYCGLVNIPNMHDIYGCYYDWGNFFLNESISFKGIEQAYLLIGKIKTPDLVNSLKKAEEENNERNIKFYSKYLKQSYMVNMVEFIINFYGLHEESFVDYEIKDFTLDALKEWFDLQKPIGYSGLVGENSQELRLSSVSKGERPICYISYNKDGYTKHCLDYKNYKDWEKHRNPIRYESNLRKNYDSKNMYHSLRLMRMGKEIANGEGIILDRRIAGDRDLLMDIRHHKYEYDELIEIIEKEKKELTEAMAKSTLPEHIDVNLVNDLLIEIRKKYYH